MDDQQDPRSAAPEDAPDPEPSEPTTKPLTLKGSFGTVLGSSMLGLDQALRDGPPPQIQAAEHMPERGGSGQDSELVIEFPEQPDPAAPDDEPRDR